MNSKEIHKALNTELNNFLEVRDGLFYFESEVGSKENLESEIEELIKSRKETEFGFEVSYNKFKDENHRKELLYLIKVEIKRLSTELFNNSKTENYYWDFCSFSVYDKTYEKRLSDFLFENDNELVDENYFIDKELKSFEQLRKYWYLEFFSEDTKTQIAKSFIKKKFFLENKRNLNSYTKDSEDVLDLCSSKISEKIIYLSELGVLDYLSKQKPFNTSKNSLASALSGIIGEPAKSIQSAINPIFNSSVAQKNNPLNTTSSVHKVTQKLLEIGFEKIKN